MNQQQYDELQQLVLDAQDRLITGEGRSGVHYELMHLLARYGKHAMSREESIKMGQKLCDEFLYASDL